jgi:hypothetical protein
MYPNDGFPLSCKMILCMSIAFAIIVSSCNRNENTTEVRDLYVWAHNDYEHEVPLHTALGYGYQMIEADVHLINEKLYVSHDYPENIDETPILEDLYLDPLQEIITQNNGDVLPGSELPFYLVIDVKSEAETTFSRLLEIIEPYRALFKRKEGGEWMEGPMKLLISGNRPELDAGSPDRIAFIDGRIPDIGAGLSSDLYPIISDNWNNYFTWDGTGDMPEDEFEKLQQFVRDVHAENKILRFWATPDREQVWQTLLYAGVDVLNVDDLSGLNHFLQEVEVKM